MRHALYALRRNQNLILDTCEIFVREPLLEWVKEAQNQNYNEDSKENLKNFDHSKNKADKVEWYPQQKIDRMKDKLVGKNSARVMMKELSTSPHSKKEYFSKIKAALVGPKEGYRYKILKQKKHCLEVEEQVDFLIEHATDPDILGRLWIGWSPYV